MNPLCGTSPVPPTSPHRPDSLLPEAIRFSPLGRRSEGGILHKSRGAGKRKIKAGKTRFSQRMHSFSTRACAGPSSGKCAKIRIRVHFRAQEFAPWEILSYDLWISSSNFGLARSGRGVFSSKRIARRASCSRLRNRNARATEAAQPSPPRAGVARRFPARWKPPKCGGPRQAQRGPPVSSPQE